MDKLEKVIKGLKYCIDYGQRIKDINNDVPCEGCPYCKYRDIRVGYGDCIDRLHLDAIEILKAQNEVIQALRNVGYPHDFQREEPWIVNYMNAITDVIKKAVHLNNG